MVLPSAGKIIPARVKFYRFAVIINFADDFADAGKIMPTKSVQLNKNVQLAAEALT